MLILPHIIIFHVPYFTTLSVVPDVQLQVRVSILPKFVVHIKWEISEPDLDEDLLVKLTVSRF